MPHPEPERGAETISSEGLDRAIGPWALGANAVNNTIGAGIFVLPGLIAAILGSAAIVAYLICAVAMTLVLTCFIEIGTVVKRSGGAIAYVEEAFGPMMGFLAWVLYAITAMMVAQAALANVFVDTVAISVPALGHGVPRVATMGLLFGGLAVVNVIGVRQGMGVAVAATVAKLLPLLFIVAAGALIMHWSELRWSGWPPAAKLGEASLLLFFAFAGAEAALATSGEIRDPERTVPRAVFGGTACFVLLYVSLQGVSQGILGSDLAHQTTAPLASVAGRILPGAGRGLILACTGISILGTVAAGMVGLPRTFFLAAENGMLPALLARVHPRFRTPHVAILTAALLLFVVAVSGAFRPLAILSSVSRLLIYLAVCLGALRMRLTRPMVPGAFRAPGGPVVPVLGALAVLWLLSHSTRVQISALAATAALAVVYYWFRQKRLARNGT
jgi:APA family basic amino acid/polyamine antiporter